MEQFNGQEERYDKQIVCDLKYGYITRKKLYKKKVSSLMTSFSLALLLFLGVSYLLVYALQYISYQIFYSGIGVSFTVDFTYLFSSLCSILGLGLPFLLLLKAHGENFLDVLDFKPTGFNSILYVLSGLGIAFLFNIPFNFLVAFLQGYGIDLSSSDVLVPTSVMGIVIMAFSSALIPAVFEEFVFRGVILKKLRKHGDKLAIVSSAMLFAVTHRSAISICVTFLIGLVLGFLYVKTENLWVPIAVHFLNNAISTASSLIYAYSTDEIGASILTTSIFYGVILVGLIATLILVIQYKFNLDEPVKHNYIGFATKFAAVLLNPLTIIYVGICIATAAFTVLGISL